MKRLFIIIIIVMVLLINILDISVNVLNVENEKIILLKMSTSFIRIY